MRVEAREDNIFVKIIEEKDGDLHIPPGFRRRNQPALRGTVEVAGPDAKVAVGDELIFHKWEDNELVYKGNKVLIIKPHSILAIK